jgi:hypothetical protein
MRKTRVGKQICVQGVPIDTSWFCPYCCATVDTASVTLRVTASTTRTYARLPHLLGHSRPPPSFGDVSGRYHKGTWAGCIVSANAPPTRTIAKLRMNHVRCSATETCRC